MLWVILLLMRFAETGVGASRAELPRSGNGAARNFQGSDGA